MRAYASLAVNAGLAILGFLTTGFLLPVGRTLPQPSTPSQSPNHPSAPSTLLSPQATVALEVSQPTGAAPAPSWPSLASESTATMVGNNSSLWSGRWPGFWNSTYQYDDPPMETLPPDIARDLPELRERAKADHLNRLRAALEFHTVAFPHRAWEASRFQFFASLPAPSIAVVGRDLCVDASPEATLWWNLIETGLELPSEGVAPIIALLDEYQRKRRELFIRIVHRVWTRVRDNGEFLVPDDVMAYFIAGHRLHLLRSGDWFELDQINERYTWLLSLEQFDADVDAILEE